MQRKILVVDDDKKTVDLIRLYLENERYIVYTAYDGRQALDIAHQYIPDLVILDRMLPVIDGLDVCQMIHAESTMPIILLTARSTEEEKLQGLDSGADDYVTKPFSPRELMARVRVILRRAGQSAGNDAAALVLDDLAIHFQAHEVYRSGELIHLTPKEFKLLETLAREPGRAFSRTELVSLVFGYGYEGLERTVDVHMMNMRKKIEPQPDQPQYVQTVYGVGYKLRKENASA